MTIASWFQKARYAPAVASSATPIAMSQRIIAGCLLALGTGLLAVGLRVERLGQQGAGRAKPETFEVVELADRNVEDVDDHVAVVHEHPLPVLATLDGHRAHAALGHVLLDPVRDGLHLRVGPAAA